MAPQTDSRRRKRRAGAATEFSVRYDLGLRRLREKRFAEAIEHLNGALEAKPGDLSALSSLGMALSAAGRLEEALSAYDEAIAASLESAQIHYNRARVLRALGLQDEAIRGCDAALALDPSLAEARVERGAALLEAGRDDEALASFDSALAMRAQLPEAHFNRAIVLERMDRLADAVAAAGEALRSDPRSAQGLLLRGRLLERLGRADEALADFTRAARVDPKNAPVHVLCGDRIAALGRSEQALRHYRNAVAADPDFAEAHDRVGLALVDLGRIDEARAAHEKAIAISPDKPGFYYNLAAITQLREDDPNFLAMTRMARDTRSYPGDEAIALCFALGKACTDQGKYAAAFAHLRAGNAAKRARIEYDERAALADLDNVRATFDAKLLAQHRGEGELSEAPIFVLGMPRSGSTLVEQILASHPRVYGAGEIADFVDSAVAVAGENLRGLFADDVDAIALQERLRGIGRRYVERIRARDGRADRIVNKMPDNFRLAGLIALALPNARIVHTRRNPVDTCLSCYSTLFSSGISFAYDLGELGRYWRAYDALIAHWRAVLPEGMMLEIEYEELVAAPEAQARRLLEHCGLEWDSRCLEFHRTRRTVRTASAAAVRKPVYTDAIDKWRRYGSDLAPLVAALGASAPDGVMAQSAPADWLGGLRNFGSRLRRLCAEGFPMSFPRKRESRAAAGAAKSGCPPSRA